MDKKSAAKYVLSVLKSSTDVAIIIMLDYVFTRGLQNKAQIKTQLSALHDFLAQADVDDSGNPNQNNGGYFREEQLSEFIDNEIYRRAIVHTLRERKEYVSLRISKFMISRSSCCI